MRRSLRDIWLFARSIWVNLALFGGMLAVASAILTLTRCFGDASWSEVLVKALYMTRIEGALDGCRRPELAAVFVYLMPVLAVLIVGDGALRLTSLYLGRRLRSGEWEELMESGMKGHTVLCGAGELGRALLNRPHQSDPALFLELMQWLENRETGGRE